MTALEAAVELSQADHAIFSREEARKLAEAMGVNAAKMPVYAIEHRPDLPKGADLTNAGCTKIGEKRMMIGADTLAEWICKQLKLEYASKFGRGSQLRECCAKLSKHFKEQGAE